jgi:hypothetical protein
MDPIKNDQIAVLNQNTDEKIITYHVADQGTLIQSKNGLLIAKVPSNHIGVSNTINGQPFLNKNYILGKVLLKLNFDQKSPRN